MSGSAVAAKDAESGKKFPPMPVLAPGALTAYGANGRAYLNWNPAIEDERVTGWQVYRSTDRKTWTRVSEKSDITPQFLDEKLDPAGYYFYAVAAITALGEDQRRSNLVAVNPRAVEDPKIVEGAMLTGADGKSVTLERKEALTIRWPDGQQLIYDKNHLRVRQWIAADGTRLMQSALYGNGIDLLGFNA